MTPYEQVVALLDEAQTIAGANHDITLMVAAGGPGHKTLIGKCGGASELVGLHLTMAHDLYLDLVGAKVAEVAS